MARRSFIAHRLALRGVNFAAVADETGLREQHLGVFFTARATPEEAEEYFSLTPACIEPGSLAFVTIPDRHYHLENELVEHFAELAAVFGLPKSHGKIYGLFFASAQPLSFTDVADRLDLSVGAVSLGLQALRDLGALHAAPGPSHRREHFVAEFELPRLLSTFLSRTVRSQLDAACARLAAIRSGPDFAAMARNNPALVQRLKSLESWQCQANSILRRALKFRR